MIDEDLEMAAVWKEAFSKLSDGSEMAKHLDQNPAMRESLTHCYLDCLVLLENEDGGISRMIELGLDKLVTICRIKEFEESGAP